MNPLFRPDEDALGGLLAGMTPQEAGNLPAPGLNAVGGLLAGLGEALPGRGSLRRAWEGSDLRQGVQNALDTASYYAGPHLSNRAEAAAAVAPMLTPEFGTVDARAAGEAFGQGRYGRGAGLLGLGVAGGLLDAFPGEAGIKGLLKGLTGAAHYAPDLGMAAAPMLARTGAASLPMDEAARMGRADSLGYTIDAYKGLHPYSGGPVTDWKGRVLEETPLKEITAVNSPGAPYAGFFSSEPDVANRFARALSNEGGAVLPARLRMQNPLVIDGQGKPAAAWQFESIARQHGMQDAYKQFKGAFEKGSNYDGVIVRNTADEGDVFIPRDAAQVRSRFAAFDPSQRGSSDLLAGLAALGLGVPAAMAAQQQLQPQR